MKSIEKARELWEILGDVPVNEEEEIDIDLDFGIIQFEKGTDIYYIWHWFEEYFDLSIVEDLIYHN